ncbi:C40 family peptidase [Planobispora rosea]|uniref:C40 family peptidase n=1 Tax=Planobispora rosea TaxID=35762 RepID=UPI000A97994A|nr:C40 family peptidase [Planobispora rosea]
MFDRRARGPGLIRQIRQDFAYRPRIRYGHRSTRMAARAVPVIAVLLVAVLAADLMVLAQLPPEQDRGSRENRENVALTRPATEEPRTGEPRTGEPRTGEPGAGSDAAGEPVRPPVQASAEPAPQPVAPLTVIRKPHLFVVAHRPLSSAAVAKVARVAGVRAIERADAAEVVLDGKRVQTLGVDPSTFRAYTPRPTATSDRLWNSLASGEIAVSFVLGNDGGMTLGKTVTAPGHALRVGAYATMGMGAIDAVVSRTTARALGIPEDNALVISAPGADTARLRAALLKVLPRGSQVATVNPVFAPSPRKVWPVEAFMTADQVRAALTAAIGKLGRPYVWGAEGPDTFDCSGLVQWAYAQAGVRVPRVTHQQFVSGPQIPLDQAQPGDLLFWRHDPTNPGYVSHVAIYWGGGKMLHAPRTGDVVKLVPVTTKNFAGAVRISPQIAARVR